MTSKTELIQLLTAFRRDGTAFHRTRVSGGIFSSSAHPGKVAHWRVVGERLIVEDDSVGHISHYGEARDFALSRLRVVNHEFVNFVQPQVTRDLVNLYCAANLFKYLCHQAEADLHGAAKMKTSSSVINPDGSWKR